MCPRGAPEGRHRLPRHELVMAVHALEGSGHILKHHVLPEGAQCRPAMYRHVVQLLDVPAVQQAVALLRPHLNVHSGDFFKAHGDAKHAAEREVEHGPTEEGQLEGVRGVMVLALRTWGEVAGGPALYQQVQVLIGLRVAHDALALLDPNPLPSLEDLLELQAPHARPSQKKPPKSFIILPLELHGQLVHHELHHGDEMQATAKHCPDDSINRNVSG
mmetsp:Transcript_34790/g.77359  ORF Transcript_34790/g.77359 Transcript_34790/m.77359 type:complete len:217 (-) Transcript_34790:338-988(-)